MSLPTVTAPADFFLNADGTEFHYVGYSEFGLFKRMCMDNGPEALVRPLLIERRQIADRAGWTDPLVARVFRCSHPNNPFGQLPSQVRLDLVNPFLDLCAEYGVYADFTQGDDWFCFPGLAGLQDFHNTFEAAAQRFHFTETENEPFKNGEAPQSGIVPPKTAYNLRDSGNYVFINETTRWPTELDLDFISFHGDRTLDYPRWPKWVCDLDDSIATLRRIVKRATALKEPNKFGAYYFDPAQARILGLRANMGGVVFHSQLGLESNGFDELTAEGFYQFCRGARGAVQP